MENNQSTPKPEDDIYFGGFIIRATDQTFKRIKEFILKETDAKLIYQKETPYYLKIEETGSSDKQ